MCLRCELHNSHDAWILRYEVLDVATFSIGNCCVSDKVMLDMGD
jgi:hypothetical protein